MSPELYNKILEALPRHPDEHTPDDHWHGCWVNHDDEIMCPNDRMADAIADFFEDCGLGIMHVRYYDYDDEDAGEHNAGWWCVYVDGQ